MHTTLSSRSSTVVIGHDQPFCVIGERINPTGRKTFAEELRGGDLSTVAVDAIAQVTAGALRFIDAKVSGIEVPAAVIERVEAAADQQAACFELAYELASHALSLPGVAGLHFISFRKDAGIAKLCTQLGLEPRIEREKSLAYAHDSALTL